jgi:hypothetical protein
MPDLPRVGARDWADPKYPDAAVPNDRGLYEKPTASGAPWEHAPATSHVYGWKLLSGGFVRRFYAASAGAPAGTTAVLVVAFKPPKVNGQHPNSIKSQYEYYFRDTSVAAKYANDFRTNPHPGHVVQALERAGVAYKKTHHTG